jgi:hypothetical protein
MDRFDRVQNLLCRGFHAFYRNREPAGRDPLRHWRRPPRLHMVRHAYDFRKKEWPDWMPPDGMLKRQPHLPHFVAGGPNNP